MQFCSRGTDFPQPQTARMKLFAVNVDDSQFGPVHKMAGCCVLQVRMHLVFKIRIFSKKLNECTAKPCELCIIVDRAWRKQSRMCQTLLHKSPSTLRPREECLPCFIIAHARFHCIKIGLKGLDQRFSTETAWGTKRDVIIMKMRFGPRNGIRSFIPKNFFQPYSLPIYRLTRNGHDVRGTSCLLHRSQQELAHLVRIFNNF